MLFVQLDTGLPKTHVQIRKEHSNMSLPRSWNDDVLALLNVARIEKTQAPTVGQYEVAAKDGIENVNGMWKEKWVINPMFSDYTDDEGVTHTKAEQEAAYQANLDAMAAASVRTQRDAKLSETDWTALTDVTMTNEMAAYRQALRDITTHANFPNLEESDWPTKAEVQK